MSVVFKKQKEIIDSSNLNKKIDLIEHNTTNSYFLEAHISHNSRF